MADTTTVSLSVLPQMQRTCTGTLNRLICLATRVVPMERVLGPVFEKGSDRLRNHGIRTP